MARILLVDDDEFFRKTLSMTLEALGHKVVAVVDGDKAWAAYNAEPFDLVIMDLIMPSKEGLETIQLFRRNQVKVKILAISGGGRVNARDLLGLARAFGADATMEKPFSNDDLIAMLRELLPAAS